MLPVEEESDGALTVHHDGTFASLRVVTIGEDLDLVSLTQMVAWDLVLTKKIRDRWPSSRDNPLGSVSLAEKAAKAGDVVLRYNFPGNGLNDDALRTLALMVLDKGARRSGAR